MARPDDELVEEVGELALASLRHGSHRVRQLLGHVRLELAPQSATRRGDPVARHPRVGRVGASLDEAEVLESP